MSYFTEISREDWLAEYERYRKLYEDQKMPLNVSETGGDFKQVEAGTHLAICNMVVDLGLQQGTYGTKHQLFIRWELPDERIDTDGTSRPMVIGRRYTASLNEQATLRKDLVAWRGKQFTPDELKKFDVFNILGACCQISVVHNEQGKARVDGVAGWPKGVPKKEAENPLIKFSDDEGSLEELPEWLQKVVNEQVREGDTSSRDEEQGIPF